MQCGQETVARVAGAHTADQVRWMKGAMSRITVIQLDRAPEADGAGHTPASKSFSCAPINPTQGPLMSHHC